MNKTLEDLLHGKWLKKVAIISAFAGEMVVYHGTAESQGYNPFLMTAPTTLGTQYSAIYQTGIISGLDNSNWGGITTGTDKPTHSEENRLRCSLLDPGSLEERLCLLRGERREKAGGNVASAQAYHVNNYNQAFVPPSGTITTEQKYAETYLVPYGCSGNRILGEKTMSALQQKHHWYQEAMAASLPLLAAVGGIYIFRRRSLRK